MPPPIEEATTIALLGQQVTRMEAVLQKVADDVSGVAVLASEQRHHNEQLSTLFSKADAALAWQQEHDKHREAYTAQFKDSVRETEAECLDAIGEVADETHMWINRFQGAAWVLGVVFALSNAIFLGLAVWLFSSVASLRESRQGIEARVLAIERGYK